MKMLTIYRIANRISLKIAELKAVIKSLEGSGSNLDEQQERQRKTLYSILASLSNFLIQQKVDEGLRKQFL